MSEKGTFEVGQQMVAFRATVYDYNRAGVIAFKLPELSPTTVERITRYWKSLADERQAVMVRVFDERGSTEPADPAPTGDYRAARGASHWQEGDEPAEQTICRQRDGAAPTEPDELQAAREAYDAAEARYKALISGTHARVSQADIFYADQHLHDCARALVVAQQQRIAELTTELEPFAETYRGFLPSLTGNEYDDPFWEWLQEHADGGLIGNHYQRAYDARHGGEG